MGPSIRTQLLAVATAAALVTPAGHADGQGVQYTSPSGVAYRSQADTGAIARAEAALAADPQSLEKTIALGTAQAGARQMREAIATFSKAIAARPGAAILYRWRGHRYLSVREFDRAAADFARGLSLDSAVYGIWYHLGILRFVRGDFRGAADAFAHARPIAPDMGELAGSYDWGWMSLMRAGRTADAAALLAAMPDSLPRVAKNAYGQRLRLYQGQSTPDAVFTPADTGDVAVATLSFGLGNWYLLKGDVARARSYFERSVRSGGWPAFGFIVSEVELRRVR